MDEQPMPMGYLCYPFDNPTYFHATPYSDAIMSMFKLGYNPLVCEAHLMGAWTKQKRFEMAKRLIEFCDTIVIFYEDKMTTMMLYELLYAKQLGKNVSTVSINKEGDSDE